MGVYMCVQVQGHSQRQRQKQSFFSSIFLPVYTVNIVQKLMQVHVSAFPSDISPHYY